LKRKIALTLLGVLVIALLTWLWKKTQSLNPADHAHTDAALRELRSLDRTINQDVLRVRYQLISSYEPVLRSYRRIQELEDVIAKPRRYLDEPANRKLTAAVDAYRASVTAKQSLIETFKVQTADLKELLAYLPEAGTGVAKAASSSGDEHLAASVNRVLQLTLFYNVTSDEKYAPIIQQEVDALSAEGEAARSFRIKRRLGTLVANIRRLLKVKPAVDGLLGQIFNVPVTEHEDEVANIYYAGYSAAEHFARRCRGVLYGLCVALIVLIAYGIRRLQQTARALAIGNERLEERVVERTRELDARNQQLDASLRELQETQARLVASAKELADASRRAGMAEVATGVLHNVGNALNSVNVSAEVVEARLKTLKVLSVAKIADVLEQHAGDLARYLTEDAQGSTMVTFLRRLGGNLGGERDEITAEVHKLQQHIGHIKWIVSKQQVYAKTMGMTERCLVAQVTDDAIGITGIALEASDIEVVRAYDEVPELLLERHKVLQILVNLMGNARHALGALSGKDKRITVRIETLDADRLRIAVEDNGVGIAAEHQDRIFTHGFTTKKDGHGFGLHTSALAAKEMGGQLTCHSAGRGAGAAFRLDLPLRAATVAPNGLSTPSDRAAVADRT
jgi:two-component system NtrC family sensor kinase